jgi:L-lactate dehydrogenase complex protein LldG
MNARETLYSKLLASDEGVRSVQSADLVVRLNGLNCASGTATAEQFERNAIAAGINVLRCTHADAADRFVEYALGKSSIVMAEDGLLRTLGIDATLGSRLPGTEILCGASAPDRDVRRFNAAGVGVTVALAGIADSGAIVVAVSAGESRSVSLLPDEHVAFLPVDRILPTFHAAAPLLESLVQVEKKSAVTLIGGPSKTADIEKVLVTGVHGPGTLTVVLLETP